MRIPLGPRPSLHRLRCVRPRRWGNADSLGALVGTGSNSVALALDYGIDVVNSAVYADPTYTDGLTALAATITEARQRGLSVIVRPLIDFLDPNLWRDANDGTVAIWLLNGAQILQSEALGAVASNWSVVETGDFNGDGFTDILWRDDSGGALAMWLMQGLQVTSSSVVGTVGSTWIVQGLNVD